MTIQTSRARRSISRKITTAVPLPLPPPPPLPLPLPPPPPPRLFNVEKRVRNS
jgi:hypothetical protein